MEEPCPKKQRIASPKPVFQLKAILSDDLSEPIPLEPVIVARIEDKKSISSIVLELSHCLPLPSLQHLKRVRKNEIILCKESDIGRTTISKLLTADDILKIEEYIISQGISADRASTLCKNVSVVEVASIPTRLRLQYEAMNQLWPCKFHPNRYLESLFNGTNFVKKEEDFILRMTSILTRLSELENTSFGICIDPRSNSIVAIATGRANLNPVMHCPMVLVDFVARSQGEGACQYDDEHFYISKNEELNFRGIPERFYSTIVNKLEEDVQFGAENINLREVRSKTAEDRFSYDNLTKYGPYLCTGYDVYLMMEPCLMCAMALLHSRVRRIFYIETSENGALQTKMKLHTVKDLNHHFEVFHCCSDRRKMFNKCF